MQMPEWSAAACVKSTCSAADVSPLSSHLQPLTACHVQQLRVGSEASRLVTTATAAAPDEGGASSSSSVVSALPRRSYGSSGLSSPWDLSPTTTDQQLLQQQQQQARLRAAAIPTGRLAACPRRALELGCLDRQSRRCLVNPTCAVVKDLLAAPCRRFIIAQAAAVALSAAIVLTMATWAFVLQWDVSQDASCLDNEPTSYRAPYFVAMFIAGALLNCKEFLGIPLL